MNDDARKPIGLKAASLLLTSGRGGPPSIQSVRTWARAGYRPRGWTGEPTILRTVRMGNDAVTCREWVAEFEAERWRMGELIRAVELERVRKKAEPARRSQRASQRAAKRYLDSMNCK